MAVGNEFVDHLPPQIRFPRAEFRGRVALMPLPQYRIPVERLKQEWAFRMRMQRLRKSRPHGPPSRITDNSEPWVRKDASITELIEASRKINETIAKWSPQPEHSSPRWLHATGCSSSADWR